MKNKFNKNSNETGAIALTAVIVITAILLTGGIAIAYTNIDIARASKNFTSSKFAKNTTVTCLEEAMNRFKSNTSYTGTINFAYPDGDSTCQAIVADDAGNPGFKTVDLTGAYEEYSYTESKLVNTNVEPFVIE